MRLVLQPEFHRALGQEALIRSLVARAGFTPISHEDYLRQKPSASLLASHYPGSSDECACLAATPPEVPVFVHVHCQYDFFSPTQQANLAHALSRATAGISPEPSHAAGLAARFPHLPWHVAPNGIDPQKFHPSTAPERAAWRGEQNIPANVPLIAFVGRLTPAKGLALLADFCREIASTPLHLLIQTLPGSVTAWQLAGLAPGRIHLFPDENFESPRPLRFCDALLSPSRSEVCPLVVLEALHCGLPVVATRSTPFFSTFSPPDLLLVDLRPSAARESLRLATSLIPPSDEQRLLRSQSVSAYSEARMIARLQEIYGSPV